MEKNPPETKPEDTKPEETKSDPKNETDPKDTNNEEDGADNKQYAEILEVTEEDVLTNPDIVDYLFKGDKSTWEQLLKDFKIDDKTLASEENKKILISNLIENGYKKPSYIQARTIPFLADTNVGVRAQSQNGTGKTLAYIVPSLMVLDTTKSLDKTSKVFLPQVIVMTPNSILVKQIRKDYEILSQGLGEKILVTHRMEKGKSKYEKGYVFLGTPKHVHDALKEHEIISFDETRMIVVDEADMVIESSKSQLGSILAAIIKLKKNIRICFISATYTDLAKTFIDDIFQQKAYEDNVMRIEIKASNLKLEKIIQYKVGCDTKKGQDKIGMVKNLIKATKTKFIIFVNTKSYAEKVNIALKQKDKPDDEKIDVVLLTGDVKGRERAIALNAFREGGARVIITTNLLARGFDERNIGIVVNFDIPIFFGDNYGKPDFETYIHRVGRTGRFGDSGIAINLYQTGDRDESNLKAIEQKYNTEMPVLPYDIDNAITTIDKKLKEIKKETDAKRKHLGENIDKTKKEEKK